MLAYLLVVALAGAPEPDPLAAGRTMLIDLYQEVDRAIGQYESSLDSMAAPPDPILGLRLETVDQGGQPPRRATMVTGIVPDSPAAGAGIQEGDRVAAIGSEPLDHESGKAVQMYLSNYPEAVPLTIERGSEQREVNLRRQVIPCLAAAHKKFEVAKWRARFAKLRRVLAQQGAHLPTMATLEGLGLAFENLQKSAKLGESMLDEIATERGLAMASACVGSIKP